MASVIAVVREVYPIGVLYTDPIEGVKFRGEAIGMDIRNIRVSAVPPGLSTPRQDKVG
ncbi:MAG: hypothetical protein NXY59_06905 [Aigarchaeota archaeon]|nr:hypothetical protein [Candidatus Pelearchaeum maunauluense]